MSVAELKHVRDCLKFQLPFEEREIDWILVDKNARSPKSPEAVSENMISQEEQSILINSSTSIKDCVVVDFHDSPHPPSDGVEKKIHFSEENKQNNDKTNHPLL